MDTHRLQSKIEKEAAEDKAPNPPPPPPPDPTSSASPSHDFSFTISLHPPLSSAPNNAVNCKKNMQTSAVDLAPADDDIFLRGHLLPLHLPSHPTAIPPRPSDFSVESFSLANLNHRKDDRQHQKHTGENEERMKSSKALSSFFGLGRSSRKGSDGGRKEEEKKRSKKGLDVSRLLKKYAGMMEHLFFFSKGEKKHDRNRGRPCSFSGYLTYKDRDGWRKKGRVSAPASVRTSPRNSGLLSASGMAFSSSDDGTMEELQSAIQAAIAHCKNSVAVVEEEKCKF